MLLGDQKVKRKEKMKEYRGSEEESGAYQASLLPPRRIFGDRNLDFLTLREIMFDAQVKRKRK